MKEIWTETPEMVIARYMTSAHKCDYCTSGIRWILFGRTSLVFSCQQHIQQAKQSC